MRTIAERKSGAARLVAAAVLAEAVVLVAVAVLAGVAPAPAQSAEAEGDTTRRSSPAFRVSDEERAAIEKALPERAAAAPARPRRLLVFDRNVGYPGHPSIARANLAIARMGERTGAWETAVSHDPQVFRAGSLRRFDAVFFNNTVGNLFTDPGLRRNLVEFVYGGGGLLGVHGTTVAFTRWPGAREDWPEFGRMLGARGARHRASDERVVIRLDDPEHPLLQPFGGRSFEYRDEFFRVGDPYSRKRVRVLLSIDVERSGLGPGKDARRPERADRDYALAWVRRYGRGRVFYSTIGHSSRVFSDARMLRFYLRAIQYALGDLEAPAVPSARLGPATRAQEKLGWRLGVTAYSFHKYTLFEAIEKTAELGIWYLGGLSFQKVSRKIPRNFDAGLSEELLARVREKLDAEGVRLVTYYVHRIPAEEAGCRAIFEFGRRMGVETFISEPLPEALDVIERHADEYGINVAIHNHGPRISPHCWSPQKILELCRGRSARMGACADVGYWLRNGIDPIEAVRALGRRLITVQLHDLDEVGPEGKDVPWGAGQGRTRELLEEIHRRGIRPSLIGLEYSRDWFDSMPEMRQCREFFDEVVVDLSAGTR